MGVHTVRSPAEAHRPPADGGAAGRLVIELLVWTVIFDTRHEGTPTHRP
jgi:hypothetical protein